MAGFGFGFAKPRATSVGAGDVPSFKDLSAQEKLLMLGSVLRGDTQSAMQIPMLAAARAKQAGERDWRSGLNLDGVPTRRAAKVGNEAGEDISAAFSPQMETVKGAAPTLRDLVPRLVEGMNRGYDVKPIIELMDKAGPSIKYERGMRYDERDPSSAPKEIFDVDKGQRRVYDADGRPMGVMNAEGYVQSVADLERAKAQATEGVKAGLDIVRLPSPDGSEAPMTRKQAAERLGGIDMTGVPTRGRGGPAVGPAPTYRTQTPADKVRAEGRAKTEVEIEALTPKARSTLDTLDRKTDFVLGALRRAAGQATGGLGGAAGLNALAAGIPETAAYNLRSTLDTIEAAVGFDELQQMRDNSPTGGAVGNLTERELSLLASLRGSLKQGQSDDQLRANIERMIGEITKVRDERKSAYERQYGAGRRAGGYSADDRARAAEILRQRRAARGEQ